MLYDDDLSHIKFGKLQREIVEDQYSGAKLVLGLGIFLIILNIGLVFVSDKPWTDMVVSMMMGPVMVAISITRFLTIKRQVDNLPVLDDKIWDYDET